MKVPLGLTFREHGLSHSSQVRATVPWPLTEVGLAVLVGTGQRATHQGCHGEANDLEVAIVMPLRLKVVVFPRVAPRHGACTVPDGGQGVGSGVAQDGQEG